MRRVNFPTGNVLYLYSRKARENLFYIFQLREIVDLSIYKTDTDLQHCYRFQRNFAKNVTMSSSSISLLQHVLRRAIAIITPRSSRRSSRSYPFAEGERQRESHASSRRMGEGRSAWAARCVARASDLLASVCMRFDTEGEHVLGRLNMSAISIQTRLVTSRL